ncbi:MAG: hypothetical protein N2317_07850 [Syntrophales bacterium]|nr:hypothetical protein [Syntrophales bacterium]
MSEAEPEIGVEPRVLDFGLIPNDAQVSRRFEITNRGGGILKWHGRVLKDKSVAMPDSRIISLYNSEVKGSGSYRVSSSLADHITLLGGWGEVGGYPVGVKGCVMKLNISGNGAKLLFWKDSEGGKFAVSLNGHFVGEINTISEVKERGEVVICDNVQYGPLIIEIIPKEGKNILEGVVVKGVHVQSVHSGSMFILPDEGVTTREVDFVTVTLDARKMKPGIFRGEILFESNGGDFLMEVYGEVVDKRAQLVAVYRYFNGSDYLYTIGTHEEEKLIRAGNFAKEGVAFFLFPAEIPGTKTLYRFATEWGGYCYSADLTGSERIRVNLRSAYPMGNIGVTKLPHTKPLYRWLHAKTGSCFLTTAPHGENIQKKGYRFDRIVGYVR